MYLKPYIDAWRDYDRQPTSVSADAVISAAKKIAAAAAFGDPEPIFRAFPEEGRELFIRTAVMLEALETPSCWMAAREIARLQDHVRQTIHGRS